MLGIHGARDKLTDSKKQENSLGNQMETYKRLITGNPEYEFIGVYADQGISGYCENRPQFQRMVEKAREQGAVFFEQTLIAKYTYKPVDPDPTS